MRTLHRFVLLLIVLSCCGCASSLSSPMRHAYHTAHQLSHQHFDPNTRIHVNKTTAQLLPEFEKIYHLGQQDRAKGLSQQEAQQNANRFSDPQLLPDSNMKLSFFTHKYSVENPQESRRLYIDGLLKTYWDGFNGRY
ncbi:Exc2 family lipoprotein [Candidatus Symbiopectobacterium sp. NZEC135]|uniref:Exc2 family lipoprotein n=1 Tax=Candidatus Symbiopectobacterium sp. NZEC135 TaxID=2820471 RepID=UPI0022265690|nr:Exc2 family lipoprotein [Candidatus Symbiopectobacterium sp. NZEC135]MCW2479125.1 Exc2 family lipoprotein [Candidatus Symbiopectobacterium sp. NZEC135]